VFSQDRNTLARFTVSCQTASDTVRIFFDDSVKAGKIVPLIKEKSTD
jgi:hypothetical protein